MSEKISLDSSDLNYSNRTLSGTVQMRFNLLKPETILYLCPVFRIKRI